MVECAEPLNMLLMVPKRGLWRACQRATVITVESCLVNGPIYDLRGGGIHIVHDSDFLKSSNVLEQT